MKNQGLLITAVFIILMLTAYNAIDDYMEDGRDQGFYNSMLEFVNKGDRNTADMGFVMCKRVNANAVDLKHAQVNCCKVYFGGDTDRCRAVRMLYGIEQ